MDTEQYKITTVDADFFRRWKAAATLPDGP